MASRLRRVLFDTDMLARLRARGAVPGFRGVRPADATFRRPLLTRSLTLRILSGIVLVPLLLGIAYIGEPVYGGFICLACAYAAFEVRSMLRNGGFAPADVLIF